MEEIIQTSNINEKGIRRNIWLYASGSMTSRLGTFMYNFAVSFYVLTLTGSGTSFAFSILFGMLPRVILSPFAGVFADRFDRKKMVVLTDVLSGGLLMLVFMVSRFVPLELWMIYGSSAMLTIFNTFFGVTINASIPSLVDEKRLVDMNSKRATIDSSASLLGPLLGGAAYGLLGFQYFLIVNGLSFIVSAVTEMFMDFNVLNKPVRPSSRDESIFESMKDGVVYLKQHDLLFGLMKYILLINFFAIGISVTLPYISIEVLKATPVENGIVQIGFPLGMLVMSIIYPKWSRGGKLYTNLALDLFLFGVLYMMLGLPVSPLMTKLGKYVKFAVIIGITFFHAFTVIMINIPITTMIQKSIDDAYQGRVNGVISMIAQVISPIGVIIFGVMLDFVPTYVLPMACGLLITLVSGLMLMDKKMMQL